jgi:uncharacterized protein YkwD
MTLPPLCRNNGRRWATSTAIVAFLCICAAPFAVAFSRASIGAALTCQRMNNTKIIKLINAYRTKNGLPILRQNPMLGMSTELKIKDMVRQSYFAHTNPEGRPFSDNVKRAKYDYRSVAEVLAKGCRSETQVLTLWAKSPAHNHALLDPAFLDINCSSSFSRGLTYVACHLGRPRIIAMNFRH